MNPRPHRNRVWTAVLPAAVLLGALGHATADDDGKLNMRLRTRVEDRQRPGQFAIVERLETWNPKQTAVIVCDMWDLHHCLNAVRRATEMAPTMDRVLKSARDQGATIIHAPSDCVDFYKDHPARLRAFNTPRSKTIPAEIGTWCYKIPAEEKGVYPIDQSDGGEDDDPAEHKAWAEKLAGMGRNPKAPWKSQTELLTIDEARDFISANGEEVWSILERRGVKNVVLLGVHLNMCVLGRPFGLRQMAKNGRNVVLMRDMTDTMYNPASAPRVNHFAGTDLMIEHVEKYVCPSITSDQLLGGVPFRFSGDKRPNATFLIADDEYRTEVSLPAFASAHLTNDFRVSYVLSPEGHRDELPGINVLSTADILVVSARRRVLPKAQLDAIRKYVAEGKPVVGLRTASHAFSPKPGESPPAGHDAWPDFDPDILGGHYHGHHGDGPNVIVKAAPSDRPHPILAGVDPAKIVGHGSLYKVSPLSKTATPLLIGTIPGQGAEPVAWVNAPETKGRVFYTSLGQIEDFASKDFQRMMKNALDWAAGKTD